MVCCPQSVRGGVAVLLRVVLLLALVLPGFFLPASEPAMAQPAGTGASPAAEPASSSQLQELARERVLAAHQLAALPRACVQRRDTAHPLFHGCIDWHSAVHGIWALVAASRITGDRSYLSVATALLTPAAIARERAWLAAHPEFEMPYGRAWFLRLAADYQRQTGDARLAGMARDVAQSLVARFARRPPEPSSRSYDSDSWALLNLQHYARHTGDAALADVVAGHVRASFADVPGTGCPAEAEELVQRGFMPVCGNWAWLVGLHMQPAPFSAWLVDFLPPASPLLRPVTAPGTAHEHGLDFARAWSLWFLWERSGDPRYLAAYLAHLRTALQQRDWWAGDYDSVAHWVAQFGMLALEVSCTSDNATSC